ncbi:hypothetical protein COB11_01570 [Candidatus Aerophobetes bacterium]|uniref:Uncharacterized protein n=1 Tax=Aerophobetes bacterium TaxID=2030807 RepID=A0A2A4YM12_UNCAE|nr:MAG: hypothetical protein COB11_01570 [Candidatus Aerophobetes bacterium]
MSTEKPRPLTGYREAQESKKDTSVDPKKFQDQMKKVTQSDETEKGKKRQLKKSEEEIEDEPVEKQLTSPGSGFSDILTGKESDQGILGPKTPQNTRAATTESSSSQFTLEDDTETSKQTAPLGSKEPEAPPTSTPPSTAAKEEPGYVESPLPKEPTEETPTAAATPELQEPGMVQAPFEDTGDIITFGEDTPDAAAQTERVSTDDTQGPKRVRKKKQKDTSLMANKTPSTAQIAKKKKEKSPEVKIVKGEPKPHELPEKVEAKPKVEKPSAKPDEKLVKEAEGKTPDTSAKELRKKPETGRVQPAPAQKAAAAEIPKEAKDLQTPKEKEKISASAAAAETTALGGKSLDLETGFGESHDKKEDDKDKTVNLEGAVTPDHAAFQAGLPQMPETPAYTNLNPQVYELFERMVGSMMIQVHNKGHEQTTITINMKGSVFDGSKIILDRYSSAPNSFNIEIATSPKGRAILMDNMNLLAQSFQEADLNFEVNQLRPVLLSSYKEDFTRKGSVTDDEDSSKDPKDEQPG